MIRQVAGITFILIALFAMHMRAGAQEAKVFSKYNYYTSEDSVVILAAFLSAVKEDDYSLSVFKNDKLVAVSENNLLKVVMPLSLFEMGSTALQYSISDKKAIVQKGTIDIVRLQPKANEVKIDLQTGGLIADGLPFFPFGFYCRPVAGLPEQEITHGFNMIGPYQSNLPAAYAERKEYMDRCAKLGMKVQYSVNSLIGSGHNGAKGLDMTDEEKEVLLKKEIVAFRDHPALLSWYINDEPDGQGRPVVLLEKAYRMIHDLDPYHPISIVFMLPQQFKDFRNTMDIAMTDPYPVPGPLDIVEQFVKQMNEDFMHEKSIWLVPQAFGGQELWNREPTAKEIRLMTYMGLVNGVKGIQYYTHAAGNLNPQSVSAWSACSNIAVEVSQMSGFLLSGENPLPVTTTDSSVILRSFSYKDDLLIIAANKENTPRSFNIEINDAAHRLSGITTASLWFENREVSFANGKINDIIDALGTRVYLIKGKAITDSTKFYPGNLTANASFEKIISPGLPVGSNTRQSFPGRSEPGTSIFADPRQSVEGMFSLRFTTTADSNGNRIRLLPIVLKAKNSYNISVWAKAKMQETMPSFRIHVEGPHQEKVFKLTKAWRQYSFIVRPDSAYSSAIVSLDLLGAGTAWFDLIQAAPDPRMSYSFNKDHLAAVSIATTVDNAQIKYTIGGKDKEQIYKQTFFVSKPSTVHAGIFVGDKKVEEASIFIPVNKALGKPVMLQSHYAPQYRGSGSSGITDGMMGSTAFKDNKWLGFSGKSVIATIDMQQAETITQVTVNFLDDPNSGIYLPPKVSVYVSGNGTDFRLAGTYVNQEVPKMGEPSLRSFTVQCKKTKARYIKIVAEAFGDIPEGYLFKGTKSWIFIDEIMVE